MAQAESDATGIPLTSGQRSGDTRQVANEEAMRNFARGKGAGQTMEKFDEFQDQAIKDWVRSFQERVAGRGGALDEYDIGGGLLERVRSAAQAASDAVSRAYADLGLEKQPIDCGEP